MAELSVNVYSITKSKIEVTNDNGDLIAVDEAKTLINYVMTQARSANVSPTMTFLGKKVIQNYDSFLIPLIEYIESFECNYTVYVESSGTDLTTTQLEEMRRRNITPIIRIDWSLVEGGLPDEFSIGVTNIVNYFPAVNADFKMVPDTIANLASIVSTLKSLGIFYYKVSPDYFVEWSETDYEILEAQIQLIKTEAIRIFEEDDIPSLFDDFIYMFRKIVAIIGDKQIGG